MAHHSSQRGRGLQIGRGVGGGIQVSPLQKGGSRKGFSHADGGGAINVHPIKRITQNVYPVLRGGCKCCTPDLTQLWNFGTIYREFYGYEMVGFNTDF